MRWWHGFGTLVFGSTLGQACAPDPGPEAHVRSHESFSVREWTVERVEDGQVLDEGCSHSIAEYPYVRVEFGERVRLTVAAWRGRIPVEDLSGQQLNAKFWCSQPREGPPRRSQGVECFRLAENSEDVTRIVEQQNIFEPGTEENEPDLEGYVEGIVGYELTLDVLSWGTVRRVGECGPNRDYTFPEIQFGMPQ